MSNNRNTENKNQVKQGFGASYNIFILLLTIFSLIVTTLILLWPMRPSIKAVLLRVDLLICGIFLVDFIIVFWRAPSKTGYFFMGGGWLDLLGSVPVIRDLPWTAIFRFARLSRAIRIVKHLQARDRDEVIKEARRNRAESALLVTFLVAIVLITMASLIVLQVERGAPDANILTGRDSFWWAFVTMTTVGYGDHVPVTASGQIVAMILMTFGVGIFAVLTGFLATRLLVQQGEGQDAEPDIAAIVREEMAQLRQENAVMRAELAELSDLLKERGSKDGEVG
jgi:voltage-gated potassium channel